MVRGMKRVVALFLAAVMLFAMTACGGNGGLNKEHVGKYMLYEMRAGETVIDSEMIKSLGMDTSYLELRADGTATMSLDENEVTEMKWTEGKLTADEESMPYTWKDGILTIEIEGEQMSFKKA